MRFRNQSQCEVKESHCNPGCFWNSIKIAYSQYGFKEKAGKLPEAQENMCDQVAIGFRAGWGVFLTNQSVKQPLFQG